MAISKLLIMFVVSAAATIGYAIPVEAPKRSLFPSALSSAVCYLLYLKILDFGGSAFFAAFVAALMMGVFGEFLSRHYKMPSTIFVLPQLITLVPGGGMYYTMSYLIQDNMESFVREAANTFSIAVALSLGIVASSLFSQSLRAFKKRSSRNARPIFHKFKSF
ncbi:MAG: threonine/serine exporter family protein [Peptoniphilus sp.]|nr:threonine/serine exporter family protein [Peptoniphilus sp.]MDY3119182.1 threonine/serine exporter family protein [Peptoniphilus sp.]